MLPVLASVLVWTRYGFSLDSITALTLAVLGAAAYAHPWIGSLRSGRRVGIALGLVGLGYWLCAGPAYVCVLSISAVEYQRRRQAWLSALLLLCGLLLPVALGCLYLGLPLQEATTRLLPYSDASRPEGDFALFLLYGLAVVPASMLFLKRDHAAAESGVARRSGLAQRFGWGRLSPGWRVLVGSCAVVVLVGAAWSPGSARRLAVMKHCRSGEWGRVLAEASKLPRDRFTLDVSYAVDLALYHTGKMGDSLFAFPQRPLSLNLGTAFASCANGYYYSERPKTVFYIGPANLEMGLVNEAEHVAHEALEVYGPHPSILKQLVLVNLVKRRPEAASILLQALCQDPVARSWAKARLATLARSPDELLDGEEVSRLRANLPSRPDGNVARWTLEEHCLGQLEENPRNRMAFEYLMAQYLIARNLEGFVRAPASHGGLRLSGPAPALPGSGAAARGPDPQGCPAVEFSGEFRGPGAIQAVCCRLGSAGEPAGPEPGDGCGGRLQQYILSLLRVSASGVSPYRRSPGQRWIERCNHKLSSMIQPHQTTCAWLWGGARAAAIGVLLWTVSCSGPVAPPAGQQQTQVERQPRLHPALHGVTIPPNICPMTFVVDEPGVWYSLRIESSSGGRYETAGKDPRMQIPLRSWRPLLRGVVGGGELTLLIGVQDAEGTRRGFAPVSLQVSADPVDPYLAYRRIHPLYNLWFDVGIYQRELTGWDEEVVIHGKDFSRGCTNCHCFANANPATMAVGTRSQEHGSATLVCRNGEVTKLATKWGYTSWHPSGKAAAYSLNQVNLFFHEGGNEVRDVCDLDSDLAVYYSGGNRVVTAPGIAAPDYLETYPAWSADGKELYFCRAPITWTDRKRVPPPGYSELRYSLVKVSFDLESGKFGEPQVVVSAEETGKSILLPRPSPDGRFVLFCMCDYGCFPIYQPSSDLYLLNLATGTHRRLELNSDQSESWHSWSSNSRWFAFSSKRHDGVFTRVYLAHVDAEGKVGEPFVLPQADPAYYDRCLQAFSLPEFASDRIRVSPRALAAAVRSGRALPVELPPMSMTAPKAKPPPAPGTGAEAQPPAPH
jgi:hypothetical protein